MIDSNNWLVGFVQDMECESIQLHDQVFLQATEMLKDDKIKMGIRKTIARMRYES